jgi:hypothetical protein
LICNKDEKRENEYGDKNKKKVTKGQEERIKGRKKKQGKDTTRELGGRGKKGK